MLVQALMIKPLCFQQLRSQPCSVIGGFLQITIRIDTDLDCNGGHISVSTSVASVPCYFIVWNRLRDHFIIHSIMPGSLQRGSTVLQIRSVVLSSSSCLKVIRVVDRNTAVHHSLDTASCPTINYWC